MHFTLRRLAGPLMLLTATVSESHGQEGFCLADEFFVENYIYFPFEADSVVNWQWFDLAAGYQRVVSFPDHGEVIVSIDDFNADVRYVLTGTQSMTGDFAYDSCFLLEAPEPEPPCFGDATLVERRSGSVGHTPIRESVQVDPDNPAWIGLEILWTELGPLPIPVRLTERIVGRSQLSIEFRNYRFEVDPSVFEIPAVCSGGSRGGAAVDFAERFAELFGERLGEELRRLPQYAGFPTVE